MIHLNSRILAVSLLSIFLLGGTGVASAMVDSVRVTGNREVEEVAIRVHVSVRPGEPLDREAIAEDIRAIYAMGFFKDVRVELQEEDGQQVVVYHVVERPLIKKVTFEGNDEVEDEDLSIALRIRPRTILDLEKLNEGIKEAKKLYDQKGYRDAEITFSISEPNESGEVTLSYTIDEKSVVRIQRIVMEGNEEFSEKQLIGILKTEKEGFFSFLSESGNLDPEILKTDVERLTAWYYDNGFIEVRVDEPEIIRIEDGLEIRFRIAEGKQFKVGLVSISGDDELDPEEKETLLGQLEMESGKTFRASRLRKDIFLITEQFGNEGYAFVNVEPQTSMEVEDQIVDIRYQVDKGPRVYFDRIEITGNTKTRGEVVRRELTVREQQLFSGSMLKKSRERVQRLGFFQEVNMTTQRSDEPDRINLLIDVKEGQTGAFTAGAGFSSADKFLFNVRLSENNIFGTGDRVALNGDMGSIRQNFNLDYVDSYFLDTFFTTSFSGFNFRIDFDDFERSGTGANVEALYPFSALGFENIWGFSLDEVRFGLAYRFEIADIGDLSNSFVTPTIDAEEGESIISSVSPTLVRNTLNHPFDPTDGSVQNLSVEFAGLGGDTDFMLVSARSRWFIPFLKTETFGTFVASTGIRVAYGFGQEGRSGKEIPLFQRFFLGGINSIRGFRTRTLGPREPVFARDINGVVTSDVPVDTTPVGGSAIFVFNQELIFPIAESLGLRGVFFFDMGNAFNKDDAFDPDLFRYAAGAGLRWQSPIGPLRIELGFPLDRENGERSSVFLFSFGAPL